MDPEIPSEVLFLTVWVVVVDIFSSLLSFCHQKDVSQAADKARIVLPK